MSNGASRSRYILVLFLFILLVPRILIRLATSTTQQTNIFMIEIKNRRNFVSLAINVSWWEYTFGNPWKRSDHQNISLANETLSTTIENQTLDESHQHQCIPQPNQRRKKAAPLTIEENQETTEKEKIIRKAICDFESLGTQVHFPHAMQQLYRCYSLWMDHPEAKAILILPDEKIQIQLYLKTFLKGVMPILHEGLNMSGIVMDIIPPETLERYKTSDKYVYRAFNGARDYDINPQHMPALHRMTEQKYAFDDTSSHTCLERKPRIGILNRNDQNGRSILNAEHIASSPAIQELSRNGTVPVKYFDGLEFKEQAAFFRSVDILLSPHGAQLTGVPFMNAPCAHLVELFPKGWLVNRFFGSLATKSQKEYSYIYMSANMSKYDQAKGRKERYAARATNLCPNTTMIVDTMHQLVDEWHQCCQRHNQQLADESDVTT